MSSASDSRFVSDVLLDYLYSDEEGEPEDVRQNSFNYPPDERLTQPSVWSQPGGDSTRASESQTADEQGADVVSRAAHVDYVPFGPFSRATIHPDGKVYWHFRAKEVQCGA